MPGSLDICFISDKALDEWILTFTKYNIDIEDGPVLKTGANGPIKSIYVRDPDQNLIEISNMV